MRKVVFEGIINGQKFDNVQDYNKKMSELIAGGSTEIVASSNTRVVNELDTNLKFNDDNQAHEFDINDFLPFFDQDSEQYYLDRLVHDDDELNKENLDRVDETLSGVFNELIDEFESDEISVEDAFAFINKLKDVRKVIEHDSDDNRQAINTLTGRITEDTKRLKTLQNTTPVLELLSAYYNSAFELAKHYLLQR